jgi:hypothetical protein
VPLVIELKCKTRGYACYTKYVYEFNVGLTVTDKYALLCLLCERYFLCELIFIQSAFNDFVLF